MVIVVDGRPFQDKMTGVAKYILSALQDLEQKHSHVEFLFVTNRKIEITLPLKQYKIIYDRSILCYIKPMIWYILMSHRIIKNLKFDYFFAGATFVPFFLQKSIKVVSVVYDLNHKFAPETMSKLHLFTHILFFKYSLLRSNHIIAISQGTKEKVKNFYNINVQDVIHPFVDPNFFKKLESSFVKTVLRKYDINFPYLLSVGTFEPRKNIDKIIKAFLELKSEDQIYAHKLVLVGKPGWKNRKIQNIIDANSMDIIQLGYVKDDDLPALYNGASIFLFPSKYEGFGMPAREALYSGVKCIASYIPELKEATKYESVYINPEDISSLKNSIIKLLYSHE